MRDRFDRVEEIFETLGTDLDKSPVVIYEDACDQHVAATIVYVLAAGDANEGLLFWDAAGEKPVTNDELVHLFMNGMLVVDGNPTGTSRIMPAFETVMLKPYGLIAMTLGMDGVDGRTEYAVGVACMSIEGNVLVAHAAEKFIDAVASVNQQNQNSEVK